jgi:hypothetical protein
MVRTRCGLHGLFYFYCRSLEGNFCCPVHSLLVRNSAAKGLVFKVFGGRIDAIPSVRGSHGYIYAAAFDSVRLVAGQPSCLFMFYYS